MARNTYTVHYKMSQFGQERAISFVAGSKAEAYEEAIFNKIPLVEKGRQAYSAWVSSITYQNGNWHFFNTCEGNPF